VTCSLIHPLEIATSLFFEHASSLLPGVILNDGFDRTSALDSTFVFSPERYFDRRFRSAPIYERGTEIPTLNLVKLHGSLSWKNTSNTVVFDAARITKLTSDQRAKVDEVRSFLEKHFIILPNLRKFHATLMDRVYYDLYQVLKSLTHGPIGGVRST
jgi:hypothetical protein